MAITTVASRYAKSLIDLAGERNIQEAVHTDMVLFSNTLAASRPLALLLKKPIVRADKKLAILQQAFGKPFNPLTLSFFQIVTRKGREAILEEIAKEYIRQYDLLKGIERATIITTTPLTDSQRTSFKAMVAKSTGGKSVELTEKVDPALIGGYVLRIGDRQVDGSIRQQLADLRTQLLN